ncbi:MAG: Rieske (2Fe-2S) protein [Actinomycetota bacterium]
MRAAALDDLPENKGMRAALDETMVPLVRSGERAFAIGNRCTHRAPRSTGERCRPEVPSPP